MVSNSDYLDVDGWNGDIRRDKWHVFKEPWWVEGLDGVAPKWVVRDEYSEYLFDTGAQALEFVHRELTNRHMARIIRMKMQELP